MLEARRAYKEAVGWIRAARPRRIDVGRFAGRAFGGSLCAGLVVLGALGLVAPGSFGGPAVGTVAGRGWPALALAGLVAVCLLIALAGRRHLGWLAARIREPFVRPLRENPSFEGAAAALAACPDPLRTRFALSWVWMPAGLAVAGVTFAFSAAYFVVDAVLSRGQIGWGGGLLLAVNAALGLLAFRVGAVRLATWRVAAGAYREVTGRYE